MTKRWMVLLVGLVLFALLAGAAQAEEYRDMGILPGDGSVMHLDGLTDRYHQVRFSLTQTRQVSIIEYNTASLRKLRLFRAGGNECLATSDGVYDDSTIGLYTNLDMMLAPGDYELRIQPFTYDSNWYTATALDLRMTSMAPSWGDIEPDDTIEQAGAALSLPIVRQSVMCVGDTDTVSVSASLPSSATLELEIMLPRDFKGEPVGGYDPQTCSFSPLLLSFLDAQGVVVRMESIGPSLTEDNKFKFAVFLPAGTSFVRLSGIPEKSWGAHYRLKLSDVGPIASAKLPKTLSMTREFSYAMPVALSPVNSSASQLTWTSSRPGIASVNANGVVTAIKNGKTTIKATSHDGAIKTSCKLTVKSNVYSKSKPKRPGKKGIYVITKSLRYSADFSEITVEVFVYNRSGRKLPYWVFDSTFITLRDAGDSGRSLGYNWVNNRGKRGSIPNNGYGVIKCKLTPRTGARKLDLRSGRYYAMVSDDAYE